MTRSTPPSADNAGFVLLAVLWVMVGAATLVLGTSLVARESIAGANNRMNLARAWWLAEDCLERSRAVIATALAEAEPVRPQGGQDPWYTLDRTVAQSPLMGVPGCDVHLRAAGTTTDVNTVDAQTLQQLLVMLRVPAVRSDSLVEAVLERLTGSARHRLDSGRPLKDEPGGARTDRARMDDIRELASLRGWADVSGVDTLLGVEPDCISLNHAPVGVLLTLPGLLDETVARIAERRIRGVVIEDLLSLEDELSQQARDSLVAAHPDLLRLTCTKPEAWILRSHAEAGVPVIRVVLEARLVRASGRPAVVGRRSWVQ